MLFIDLDDFKTVNDTLGHAVGDQLLRAAGRRLRRCIRGGDLVARLGGDEFAILCRPPDAPERAGVDVAKRVLSAFEVPISVGGHLLPVRLSVGVATSAHSGGRPEDLLRDADVAMYEAKESGKGRYAVFDPAMRDVVVRRHGLREELERAIERRRADRRIPADHRPRHGRRRARWRRSCAGSTRRAAASPPGEFIPLAEETGLIVPLGRFVLEEACRRAQRRGRPPGEPLSVQVNLSARELEDDGADRDRHDGACARRASTPAGSCSRSPRRCSCAMPRGARDRSNALRDARACGSRSTTSERATRR